MPSSPKNESDKARIQVVLPEALRKQLDREIFEGKEGGRYEKGVDRSKWIEEAIRQRLDRMKKK